MTITEAVQRLNMTRAAIHNAVNAGKIRSQVVLGRRVLIRSDVEAYRPRSYEGKRDSNQSESTAYNPALTPAERARLLMEWADSHERSGDGSPRLSDDATSRAALYAGTGADR